MSHNNIDLLYNYLIPINNNNMGCCCCKNNNVCTQCKKPINNNNLSCTYCINKKTSSQTDNKQSNTNIKTFDPNPQKLVQTKGINIANVPAVQLQNIDPIINNPKPNPKTKLKPPDPKPENELESDHEYNLAIKLDIKQTFQKNLKIKVYKKINEIILNELYKTSSFNKLIQQLKDQLGQCQIKIKDQVSRIYQSHQINNSEKMSEDLIKLKHIYDPIDLRTIYQLNQSIDRVRNKRIVFIFGASASQINFFCQFFQINLTQNDYIKNNKHQISYFKQFEQNGDIIYPFPTYSCIQEPDEITLFISYTFKNLLNKCRQYSVILLVSNTKLHKSVPKCLNILHRCFKQNIQQVLNNLIVYYFKKDNKKLAVDNLKSFRQFKYYDLSNIKYFQSRRQVYKQITFIQPKQQYIMSIQPQISNIIINEQQFLSDVALKYFQHRQIKQFTNCIQQLQNYSKYKPNQIRRLRNIKLQYMETKLKDQFKKIKAKCVELFEYLLKNPNYQIKDFLYEKNLLNTLSSPKFKLFNLNKQANDCYHSVSSQCNKLAKQLIQNIFRKPCSNQSDISKLIQQVKKISNVIDKLLQNDPNKKFIDSIISDKINQFRRKSNEERQKLKPIIKVLVKGNTRETEFNNIIQNVRRNQFQKDETDLKRILDLLKESTNKINYAQIKKLMIPKKRDLQNKLKYDQVCINLYNQSKDKIEQIYKTLLSQMIKIISNKKPTDLEIKLYKQISSQIAIIQEMDLFKFDESYKKQKQEFQKYLGNNSEIEMQQKILSTLKSILNTDDVNKFDSISKMIQQIKQKQKNNMLKAAKCLQLLKQIKESLNYIFANYIQKLITIFTTLEPLKQQKIIQAYESFCKKVSSTGYITKAQEQLQKYEKVKENYYKEVQTRIKNQVQTVKIINEQTENNDSDRTRYYSQLERSLTTLINLVSTNAKLKQQLKKNCVKIQIQVDNLYQKCIYLISLQQIEMEQRKEFQINYDNIKIINITITKNDIKEYIKLPNIDGITKQLQLKVEKIKNGYNINQLNLFVQKLIKLEKFKMQFIYIKMKIEKAIMQMVEKYKKQKKDLQVLIQQLNATTEGELLMRQNPLFIQAIQILDNQKRFRFGIDYVLQKIEFQNGQQDKIKLKDRFLTYEKLFEQLVRKNNNTNRDSNITKLVKQTKTKYDLKFNESNFKKSLNNLQQLLSYICSIWTLIHTKKMISVKGGQIQNARALFKPHAAQIVAIFRIFGFEKGYENNLVQILTGEGKSAILAFCSIIFALNGFQINCACYSAYLSERDYSDFLPLFEAFGLTQRIYYGTFNKICSRILDQKGEIRNLVGDLITKGDYTIQNKYNNIPKILMIDQVDVFFSQQFYGKYYQPSFALRNPLFKQLVDFIWINKNLKGKAFIQKINKSNQYSKFTSQYPAYKQLIDEGIKEMIHALMTIDSASQGYYNKTIDKIGYQQQDRIDYDVTYGYHTLFNYYKLKQQGTINSLQTLNKNTFFQISCGKYSYAEIPKQFKYTVGVTGTLKNINPTTKDIIKNIYNIKKFTYIPSVYGENILVFHKDQNIYIYNEVEFHGKLKDKILDKIKIDRAVLVFFQSQTKLKQFQKKYKLQNMTYYTEKANNQEKERMVREGTSKKKITLLVRSFGRGTDFICRDKTVIANNGVHVIQTFLSLDISQQTQIKGRTARQGDPGSYELIILDKQLESFDIMLNEIMNNQGNKLYPLLDGKRNIQFDRRCKLINKEAEDALIVHKDSHEFYQYLIKKNIPKVKEALLKFNKGPQIKVSVFRTAILLDVTGSMSSILQSTKSIIDMTIYQIKDILKQNNYHQDAFQIQFVCYRSYNSKMSQLLVNSNWQTKSANLSAFLKNQSAFRGSSEGPEAIEVALNFVYEQRKNIQINQILLIGDAPPTKIENIENLRRNGAQPNYWKSSSIGNYKQQAQKLKVEGIKVYSFYLNNWAKSQFQQIANITGGTCKFMDPYATKVNEDLKGKVIQQILRDIDANLVVKHFNKYLRHNK